MDRRRSVSGTDILYLVLFPKVAENVGILFEISQYAVRQPFRGRAQAAGNAGNFYDFPGFTGGPTPNNLGAGRF